MINRKWSIKAGLKNKKPDIRDIIKILLKNRGLKTKTQINDFFNPPDPYAYQAGKIKLDKKAIVKACRRIKQAIENKEKIVIYGDYDADGICATALLWETLDSLKADVLPFIPDREKHGYGLSKKGIDDLLLNYRSSAPGLLITVDNGITAHKPAAYAGKKGIEVIITDHHQPSVHNLPQVHSIIWSDQVCGAAVAWFFSREIYRFFKKKLSDFKAGKALELTCLATITDLMPLQGINRSLVVYGLKEMRQSRRLGIKALSEAAGLKQEEIDTYHLGYILGPRLNAAGRLDDAFDSLRLLCARRDEKARTLACRLGVINQQRQQLTEDVFLSARKKVLAMVKKEKLLLAAGRNYNAGVIGLAAGRLVEEFYRPAIVISRSGRFSKGSARSIKGFNIIAFLRQFESLFVDIGGHPMAAGFTIETKKITIAAKKLAQAAKKTIKDQWLEPIINIDLEINLSCLNWQLFEAIEKFAPFGLNNPKPVFVSRKVKLLSFRTVGRDSRHLKLKFQPSIEAIAFNFGYLEKKLKSGQLIDICYVIEKNCWNGNEKLELKIKDIH